MIILTEVIRRSFQLSFNETLDKKSFRGEHCSELFGIENIFDYPLGFTFLLFCSRSTLKSTTKHTYTVCTQEAYALALVEL